MRLLYKDGPLTDELDKILYEYQIMYPDLFRIVTSKNLGLRALNLGLKNCRNDLVARMDTDDISLPDRCEKQLEMFKQDSELDIVGTWIDEFYDNPNEIISSRIVPKTHDEIYEFSKEEVHLIILQLCIEKVRFLNVVDIQI